MTFKQLLRKYSCLRAELFDAYQAPPRGPESALARTQRLDEPTSVRRQDFFRSNLLAGRGDAFTRSTRSAFPSEMQHSQAAATGQRLPRVL